MDKKIIRNIKQKAFIQIVIVEGDGTESPVREVNYFYDVERDLIRFKEDPCEKDAVKEFLELCKEFIEAEKKIDKSQYACKGDLDYLYRFIGHKGWEILKDWRERGLI